MASAVLERGERGPRVAERCYLVSVARSRAARVFRRSSSSSTIISGSSPAAHRGSSTVKVGTFVRLALQRDAAAAGVHDLLRDPQTQAQPCMMSGRDGARERAEDPGLFLLRDPNAVVADTIRPVTSRRGRRSRWGVRPPHLSAFETRFVTTRSTRAASQVPCTGARASTLTLTWSRWISGSKRSRTSRTTSRRSTGPGPD